MVSVVQDFGFGEIHDSKRKEDRKKDKIIKESNEGQQGGGNTQRSYLARLGCISAG